MPIKALIFDVGGVLLRTEELSGRQKWADRFGLGPWELAEAVFDCPEAAAATIGKAAEEEVWATVRRRFSLTDAELAEFRNDFWSGDQFDDSLLDWVAARRGKYRTGILSNAWGGARRFLTSQAKVTAAFETLVISAEEGVRKPEPTIYERALQRLGVAAEDAVFVDDVLENIEAARQVGLAGIHFQKGLDLSAEMARLGIV
jgi:putative hydrolase of the HAD superfamily